MRITKDTLVFSSAHFITYNGDACETLHGHNFGVAAEVAGPLDENYYVVDFVALTRRLMELVADLDHRVLLPTEHPRIRVTASNSEVEARFGRRRWVFPRGDCVLLPIANTTAELLARYLAKELAESARSLTASRLSSVRVEVDECNGQLAVCVLALPSED